MDCVVFCLQSLRHRNPPHWQLQNKVSRLEKEEVTKKEEKKEGAGIVEKGQLCDEKRRKVICIL